jgi:hypothetical protein
MQSKSERLAEAAGKLKMILDEHHTRKLMQGKKVKNGLEMKYNDIKLLVQANELHYDKGQRKCHDFTIFEHIEVIFWANKKAVKCWEDLVLVFYLPLQDQAYKWKAKHLMGFIS